MNKLKTTDYIVIAWSIFIMALLWQVLVVNHHQDLERDKYYATHCKEVYRFSIAGSKTYECSKP